MAGNKIDIYVNGTSYTLKEGENYTKLKDKNLNQILSIWDKDKNHKIEGDEFLKLQREVKGDYLKEDSNKKRIFSGAFYRNDDNTVDLKRKYIDENNKICTEVKTYIVEPKYDIESSGTIISTSQEYDINDNKTKSSKYVDIDGDGIVEVVREYDKNGNEVKISADQNGDGKIDYIQTWEYDENGNEIKYSKDKNGDGKVDYIQTWEYDENGNEIRYTRDDNGDGKVDYIRTWEYDEKDNEIKYSKDKNEDGKMDYVETREYDENGNNIKISIDNDGDGKVDIIMYKKNYE